MAQGDGSQVEWLDELVDQIRLFHETALRKSGGLFGEHAASLYSACARPLQSAFGSLIYETPYEQAALFHGIICDHVFVDGNKRTGSLAALWVLASYGVFGTAESLPSLKIRFLGELAVETASGNVSVEQATFWLRRIFEDVEA